MKELFIISGGQTGVDRAALDVARSLNLPCGGWCPAGRRAEDGPVSSSYPLQDTDSRRYLSRTKKNVLEAHATLILTRGAPSGGTRTTCRLAGIYRKPCLIIDLAQEKTDSVVHKIEAWLQSRIQTEGGETFRLNIAGPRESACPGIYREAVLLLTLVLTAEM